MKRWRWLVMSLLWASSAKAGESLFGRAYTVETMPAGRFEIEQTTRWRSGRSFGTYQALDLRSEVEYGITDDLQAALYVNTGYIYANGAPDDDDALGATGFSRNRFYLQSLAAEFIYRILSPYSDGIGLALYMEPEVYVSDYHNGLRYSGTLATEYRLLLQKNFFDDTLVLVYNLVFEIEFIRFRGEETWKSELDWNNELGASLRVAPGLYVGLEGRNHNEYGNFVTHEHSIFWVGPVAHYASQHIWATLSAFKQVYGTPNGLGPNGALIGNGLFLRSHEDWEVTAKMGVPF